MNDDIGAMATDIDNWLDREVPFSYQDGKAAQDWQRVAKISEENGEVVRAMMDITGVNPRRGMSGSIDAVTGELADVALTAALAIQHFTKDWGETERILWDRLVSVWSRVPVSRGE
jgi:hypothetical protein